MSAFALPSTVQFEHGQFVTMASLVNRVKEPKTLPIMEIVGVIVEHFKSDLAVGYWVRMLSRYAWHTEIAFSTGSKLLTGEFRVDEKDIAQAPQVALDFLFGHDRIEKEKT